MSGTIMLRSADLLNAIYPQLKSQIMQEPEIAKQTCSYIVWTDGKNIYARNCTTGKIDFSGTDASDVIQSAINSMVNSGGGRIFVKAGTYTLTRAIRLYSNMMIEGEGALTLFKIANVVESQIASPASSGQNTVTVSDASKFKVGQQVFIGTKSTTSSNWEINRIAGISGNTITLVQPLRNNYSTTDTVYTAFHGIEAYNSQYVVIKDIAIDGNKSNNYTYSQYDTSVYAKAYDEGIGWTEAAFLVQNGVHISNCSSSVVKGVEVTNIAGWAGIALIRTTASRVHGCETTYGFRHGVLVYNGANYNVISNCYSAYNGTTSASFVKHNYIFENCSYNILANSISAYSSQNGFYSYDLQYGLLIGNIFIENPFGISMYMSSPSSTKTAIVGNVFYGRSSGGTNIMTDGYTNEIEIIGNLMYHAWKYSSHISVYGSKVNIQGNYISGGRYGVRIESSSASNITIEGNYMFGLLGDDSYPSYGVYVQGSNIDIKNNVVQGNNTTYYGIYIASGASYVNITGNSFYSLKTAPIYYGNVQNLVIINNIGYNPQPASTLSLSSSPATIGPYPYPVMVVVSGGSVSSISIRGTATGLTSGTFYMYPGDTMTITYSTAPTVTVYPM